MGILDADAHEDETTVFLINDELFCIRLVRAQWSAISESRSCVVSVIDGDLRRRYFFLAVSESDMLFDADSELAQQYHATVAK